MIKIENLYKSFGEKEVLKGVNLEINKGDQIAIIGQSGCGKSVLLRNLIGLMKPDSGKVLLDGNNVSKMRQKELYTIRKRFGMLFQNSALFDSMTVAENISIGLKEHTNLSDNEIIKIVSKKLEQVGLPNIENLKPSELSGGMQKRVGLARAIAMNPEIILYDEPTTGLDPIMATIIDNLIFSLGKKLNATSIIITHDMRSVFGITNRVAMLHEGKIIFDGTPEGIKESKNATVKKFINGEV